MKILAALSRFPWPLEKGDKLRAYYQLRDLSRHHEVHLICLNDQPVSDEDRKALYFCASVQVIHHPKILVATNLLRSLFNRIPFQVNYFRSPKMFRAMQETIQAQAIDVVMVQLIRLGMNLPFMEVETSWFLDYMDCFSIGMAQRQAEAKGLRKWIVGMEASRLKAYEARIAARFDELGIISERDADGLPPVLREVVHILPNGVGDHFFEDLPAATPPRYDLIFFGNMGYHPNVQSARFLVEEVLPEVHQLGLRPKLCIAGARPAKVIQAYASEDIEVTGFVDDIRSYVRASRLSIAPVIGGQGLQNKLLESMAMGLPTLTTPLAHAAVDAEAGRELVVCPDARAFAREIKRLLEDAEAARTIGEAGRKFVEQHYRWEAMNLRLAQALELAAQS